MTKNMERRTFLEAAIAIVPLVALGQSLTPQTSARPVKIEAIIEQRKLRRKVHGMAAALMLFAADGQVAVEAFQNHLLVTHHAGLVNAVNMDTGYVNYLSDPFLGGRNLAGLCPAAWALSRPSKVEPTAASDDSGRVADHCYQIAC